MCLIIHKPAGQLVPLESIKSAMAHNPDGVGIMAEGKAQRWLKLKPSKVKRRLDRLQDIEAAVHFRWATHGKVTVENCHPYQTHDGGFLMHNGVMSKYKPAHPLAKTGGVYMVKRLSEDVSDTREFIRLFVDPMLEKSGGVLDLEAVKSEAIGQQLLFMSPQGCFTRTGSAWQEHEGCHYSNIYAWDNDYQYSYTVGSYDGKGFAADMTESDWKRWIARANSRYCQTHPEDDKPGVQSSIIDLSAARAKKNERRDIVPYSGALAPLFGAGDIDTREGDDYENPREDAEFPPESAEDILDDTLERYQSDINFADTDAIESEDWDLYGRLGDGTLDTSEFLLSITPATKLRLYAQLIRKGKANE